MEKPYIRKPRMYFDVGANPNNVTFDDGNELRRNIPWLHDVEAHWAYPGPTSIEVDGLPETEQERAIERVTHAF